MMTRPWSTFKMFTIANIVALALGACTFQPPTGSNSQQPGAQAGCPTPTALTGVSVGEEESEQASASPVGVEEVSGVTSTAQLSPAEREAMLDGVNLPGPARPDSADAASAPPAPGTESQLGADGATTARAPAPTFTPCP